MKNSEKNLELSETGPVVHIRLDLEDAGHMRESLHKMIESYDWDLWNEEGKANLRHDAFRLLNALTLDYDQVHDLIRKAG